MCAKSRREALRAPVLDGHYDSNLAPAQGKKGKKAKKTRLPVDWWAKETELLVELTDNSERSFG